jgi:hypothetical protein
MDPTIGPEAIDTYFRNWGSELTLTYDYTAPFSVPEPRLFVFLLVCLILSVAYHSTQDRKKPRDPRAHPVFPKPPP